MSVSTEDFLKNIYQLKVDHGMKANSSNLAKRLGISNAAVTDMARKLSAKGLIDYQKYKEISLTAKGTSQALNVIRKHRLWELFLDRVLHIPIAELHREAEMLEHHASNTLTDKIDEYLGFPEFDPHGDPIPDSTGNVPKSDNIPLSEAKAGKSYVIDRVYHNSDELTTYFSRNNIVVGTDVSVLHPPQSPETVSVELGDNKFDIDASIATKVLVKAKNE